MRVSFLLKYWLPVLVWGGIIFGLSSIPSLSTGLGRWDFFLRKGAHVGEYFILSGLLVRAMRWSWPAQDRKRIVIWCFLVVLLYAASDEFHQSFVPGRGPSVVDVIIDSGGIILFLILYGKAWGVVERWTSVP